MSKDNKCPPIGWNFDNSYAELPETFYSKVKPTPVRSPQLVILNDSLAISLGLDIQGLKSNEGIEVLAGNKLLEGFFPLAQAYAGHQFGHFTMLGDGRAILLGEQLNAKGERFDIQLKGPGRTPYSRGGDGRAGLGPMLREYIISEAMNALGIPTTRSLTVVTTGESVVRETLQPGAILTRTASSHIRVGTFQYIANWGSVEELKQLADYTINRHFPNIKDSDDKYLGLLREVSKRQAELIAKWQLVGFIHGVMNTDNMAIGGETIDYGPCAFMDTYDTKTVFSSIDRHGRYAYENQPKIGAWNLARFAETLLPLLHQEESQAITIAQQELEKFMPQYESIWLKGMRAKLGLFGEVPEDEALINSLLSIMEKHKADYTNTFRTLTLNSKDKKDITDMNNKYGIFKATEFIQWQEKWMGRKARQQEKMESSYQLMKSSNPAVIPRNHRVEEALEAAVGEQDYRVMEELLEVLKDPYAYTSDQIPYSALPSESSQPYKTFCGT
ncbi:protein adenylyltransferase SelO [Desulfuribacillus alkaliarsenatis]|uniref:Protein nucleotidyltransferase YdiU n=1 Tax=Desulfuribacillus alkaliarsenatis TaxID=766136 RepID=A0A1E5G264_9FIRM|nr:YdiU family protein [Desulfuribacillus alkaliarsenatis]OEF97078.1 hypothetical protein BHF68_05620 [Desulfuribacillus alkaliarsenatis]